MNVIDELLRFQTDRKLHEREYDWTVEATNIVEELLEALGVNDRNVAILSVGDMMLRVQEKQEQGLIKPPTEHEQVDAFADVIVFAIGAITKLGYNPTYVLEQVSKEINSRKGEIIDGKFVKDKSIEAKAQWYKSNFKHCKLVLISKRQREAYFAVNGDYGTDKEVQEWLKMLM